MHDQCLHTFLSSKIRRPFQLQPIKRLFRLSYHTMYCHEMFASVFFCSSALHFSCKPFGKSCSLRCVRATHTCTQPGYVRLKVVIRYSQSDVISSKAGPNGQAHLLIEWNVLLSCCQIHNKRERERSFHVILSAMSGRDIWQM